MNGATLRPRARGAVPAIVVLGVLFGGALAGAGWRSLQPQSLVRDGSPSLDAWRALLADGAFWESLRFTVQYTAVRDRPVGRRRARARRDAAPRRTPRDAARRRTRADPPSRRRHDRDRVACARRARRAAARRPAGRPDRRPRRPRDRARVPLQGGAVPDAARARRLDAGCQRARGGRRRARRRARCTAAPRRLAVGAHRA